MIYRLKSGDAASRKPQAVHRTPDLHELLPFLQVQQCRQKKNYCAGEENYPVFQCNECPRGFIYIVRRSERIEKNIPLALAQGILQDQKEDPEDDHHNGSSVPVPDKCGKHECHHPKEEDGNHHLNRH